VTNRESVGTEHVYLADFGLTRRGATGHRTSGGDFLGSPTYAAPEHLRGEPVDARTDAYSLACVLFACLSGRPPFQGAVPEVIQGHLNREPPSLTEVVPSLPPGIDEVIRRGMAKKPTTRYATCRELIAAARQALSQPVRRPPAVPVGPRQTGPSQQRPQQTTPYRPQQSATPPGGYQRPPMSSADPVRLRPPVPAGASTAFTSSDSSGGTRWIAPVLVGIVAIGLIVAAIFLFSSDDQPSGPGGDEPATTTTTTLPSIKVGDDDPDAGDSSSEDSSEAGDASETSGR
jgi:serine/threonine-protein kinase